MKHHWLRYLLICVLLTGLPLIPALAASGRTEAAQNTDYPELQEFILEEGDTGNTEAPTEGESSGETADSAPELLTEFRVLDIATGEVLTVPVREYVIGAVCAEMPASFEPEALKAQAVAAHTYAQRQAMISRSQENEALQGADFSNDPACYQAYCTEEEIRELYGEHYEEYYSKVADAVDAVLAEVLVYEDEPIIAAFHAMSSGTTESAEHVWGTDVAYLQSVESASDTEAPQYSQSVTYTEDETAQRLEAAHSGLTLGNDAGDWFGKPVVSDAGTVLQVTVGNSIFTGQEIRQIFSLRSAVFEVAYSDGSFTFTTRGYGHGVGMSQYGANAMAKEGADYREILAHYYPGTELTE